MIAQNRPFRSIYLILFSLFIIPGVISSIGCDGDSNDDQPGNIYNNGNGQNVTQTVLSATIRWTSHGIPHIKADDFKSLAFGQGYAFAKDGLCIFADQIIKVRSERALYFGPGEGKKNIVSDLGYKALNVYSDAQDNFSSMPKNTQEILIGYAAGYNKFLADTGTADLAPECQNASWVTPIDEIDLLAYYVSLSLLASGEILLPYLVDAAPPKTPGTTAHRQDLKTIYSAQNKKFTHEEIAGLNLPSLKNLPIGSNGWGIGRDMTENGRGVLLANPHFPHRGPLKFHESHLTIPGVLNIYGGSLYGTPGVLIGFNDHVAWTHTVADSSHFTVYELTLAEGSPTSYKYDNTIRQMTSREIAIEVLQNNGTITEERRTIYSSHYGLMFEVWPFITWNHRTAYTIKDANKHNFEIISQWIAMDTAANLDEFKRAFKDYNGIPWVNTMYADDEGNAFYIDGTRVPHLKAEALTAFKNSLATNSFEALIKSTLYDLGIMLLDGSDSLYEWQGDNGPGLVPYHLAPKLERTDFVSNCNDSHWLTNPQEPLEGYSMLFGPEGTARSLRTRLGLKLLADSAGDDGLFSADDVREALFSNRALQGELTYEALLERCQNQGNTGVDIKTGLFSTESVNIAEACDALAAWDGRMNLNSTAAHLFREFASRFNSNYYATPFDPENPATTPRGLAPAPEKGDDPVLQCLARATRDLEKAGIAPDAALGDVQFTTKGQEKIPFHGGSNSGNFNIIRYADPSDILGNRTLLPEPAAQNVINRETGLHSEGYYINYGTSLVFALEFTENGPKAQGLLTYSQSSDSRSPHFADQTRLFSQSQFRPMLFAEEEIAADVKSEITIISEINK